VAHAVSAFSERSDHMSPVAALLAALLHAATALALFWVSPLNRHDIEDSAIEVTIEQPKPPPEPPPPQETAKPPMTPTPPALTPPAQPPAAAVEPTPPPPMVAVKPEPKPQPPPASTKQLGLPARPSVEPEEKKAEAKLEPNLEPKPEPTPEPKPQATQEAVVQPVEPTPPAAEETLEKVLPPVEPPRAPLTMRDFVKVLPPPPAPPAQHPPPQQHSQQQPPSPLSPKPPAQEQQQASVSAFHNPADAFGHARVHDSYLEAIARRMSQYRFVPKSMKGLNTQGVVVLHLVVARDGRLLSSAIAKSSGNPPMDLAVLDTAQKAAPYGPLPPELSGNSVTFVLSVPYKFVAGQ
jgi:TonB family protein